MSYRIYTTDAVILKKRDVGEADQVFSFFTKEFGRVEVTAQGVRQLKSKLRYSLAGLSFLRIAFVATAGEYWRLVDAQETMALDEIRLGGYKQRYVFWIFSLLTRLLQGEERDSEIWQELENFLFFLNDPKILKEEAQKSFMAASFNIIGLLGYAINPEESNDPVSAIRHALSQSML